MSTSKKYNEALSNFEFVIGKSKNLYTEQALLGAARITFSQKEYSRAIGYYKKLATLTETRNNLIEAKTGIMRSYYLLNDYDNTINSAKELLNTDKLSDVIAREARFKMAKSLYAKERNALALEEFQTLATEVSSPEGAESKYLTAEILFKQGEYQKAEEVIGDFRRKNNATPVLDGQRFYSLVGYFCCSGRQFSGIANFTKHNRLL
ncbi:MAG: tetratricopeptide repeat protein [Bacteroidales bacterium]|nr:tetratricopeptide repeat protein [Bacteroidales bacterium]